MKQLVINKEALKHNINKVKEYAKKFSKNDEYTIIGIVKGNGYGLNLIQYAELLSNQRNWIFGSSNTGGGYNS